MEDLLKYLDSGNKENSQKLANKKNTIKSKFADEQE